MTRFSFNLSFIEGKYCIAKSRFNPNGLDKVKAFVHNRKRWIRESRRNVD